MTDLTLATPPVRHSRTLVTGVLPGFGLAFGWTVVWLSFVVLIPLGGFPQDFHADVAAVPRRHHHAARSGELPAHVRRQTR